MGTEVEPDPTLRRLAPRVWVGGSPLRLFRLTDAGDRFLAALPTVPRAGGEARLVDRLISAGAAHPRPAPGSGPLTAADVTVVVPVRDRPGPLSSLLGSVRSDPGAEVARIVVVDDGSRDSAMLDSVVAEHGAELVRLGAPGGPAAGPAAARNAGEAEAVTPLVAFVDSDVVVEPGWLDALLGHFADPRVAVVGPRTVSAAGGPGALPDYEAAHSPLDMGAVPARVGRGSPVGYLPAAALVVRRDVVTALGGFDASMRVGEDVDLVWRAEEAGHRIRYEPRAVVRHEPRASWPEWIRQRFAYGTSAAELEEHHPGRLAPAVMSPWTALAWVAALVGRPVAGGAVALGSGVALGARLPDVPAPDALRMAVVGHLGGGRRLAHAAVREWWPLTALASVVSRRARRAAVVSAAVRLAQAGGPVTDRGIVLLDDLVYGAGVWAGMARAVLRRTPRPPGTRSPRPPGSRSPRPPGSRWAALGAVRPRLASWP